MTRNRPDKTKVLQDEIRRQFGSAGTARFLQTLPVFQVEHRPSERFRNLLSELDREEAEQRRSATSYHRG